MKRQYPYDFVLSFAGEDRKIVEEVKELLERNHFSVFYDLDEREFLLGKDLAEYFSKLYQEDGKYCVMFISKYYKRKPWTKWERRAALARAFKSKREYIIPYLLDNSRLPSVPETIGMARYPDISPREFAELLSKKYHKERDSLEIMDGIFIRNPEVPGETLTVYRDTNIVPTVRWRDDTFYEYERGVRFNFCIINTTDEDLIVNHSCLRGHDLRLSHEWRTGPYLEILNLLCEPTDSISDTSIQPHEAKNFGFRICSFCWEEIEFWDENGFKEDFIFRKLGPSRVLSIFPDEIEGSNRAMEEVLKSLSRNKFEILDNVKFEICIELELGTEFCPICVESIIYKNRGRFVNARKVRGYLEGFT